jgi:hypothetical protein
MKPLLKVDNRRTARVPDTPPTYWQNRHIDAIRGDDQRKEIVDGRCDLSVDDRYALHSDIDNLSDWAKAKRCQWPEMVTRDG